MTLGQKIRNALDAAKAKDDDIACILLNPYDWHQYRTQVAKAERCKPEELERVTMDGVPIMPEKSILSGNIMVY